MLTYLFTICTMATLVSTAAAYTVVVDRFQNPFTGSVVVVGGVLPWITIAGIFGWLPSWDYLMTAGLFGSGTLFLGALIRFWLGARFSNWEKASCALFLGILASVGFFISYALPFAHGV